MKTIQVNKSININTAITALQAVGIVVITARAASDTFASPIIKQAEIIVGDDTDIAAAQSILDAFDPIVAQAEIEAEEAAEKTRAEKLRTLAEFLRTAPRNVQEKFADVQAELDQARAAIIADRAAIAECVRHTKDIEQKMNVRFGYTPLTWEMP